MLDSQIRRLKSDDDILLATRNGEMGFLEGFFLGSTSKCVEAEIRAKTYSLLDEIREENEEIKDLIKRIIKSQKS